MLALIDESTPEGPRGVHYVVSSAVVIEELDDCRGKLLALTAARKRPFHWSSEGVQMRDAMLACFAELPVSVLTVIHYPVPAKRQEIARSSALRLLFSQLAQEGIAEAVIESRGIQDRADRQTLIQAQTDGLIGREFVYRFDSKSEPLLWLPDAAAGIYSEAELRKGDAGQRLLTLQQNVHVIDVQRIQP